MSVFAGKLVLSPKACRRLGVTDRYSIHRLVTDLTNSVSDRVLWVDDGEHLEGRVIKLLSTEDFGCVTVADDVQFASCAVPDSFFQQKKFRFSLLVNPTITQEGKIRAIREREEIRSWLVRKMADHGMEAEIQSIRQPRVIKFTKKNCRVLFYEVKVDGFLKVTNYEAFMHAVCQGIGRSKAFGCGLLQLALK